MRSLVLASIVVVVAGCAESPRPSTTSPPPVEGAAASARYLALGDSFTIGTGGAPSRSFPARLVDRWRASGCAVELSNVAVNGYTTDDLIEKELPTVASFKPTLVTVAVGANDIVRGSTLVDYRAKVKRILDAAKAGGARVVVIPQPDWSRSPTAASFGTQPALDASITAFNAALAEEARAKSLVFVDLSPLMRDEAAKGMVAGDGLHPNEQAYDAWAEELFRVVPSPCKP